MQTIPLDPGALVVKAINTGDALDIIAGMIEQGATGVDIIDARGRHLDLIDLECIFDEETAQGVEVLEHRVRGGA
jgi:hypothetical protein